MSFGNRWKRGRPTKDGFHKITRGDTSLHGEDAILDDTEEMRKIETEQKEIEQNIIDITDPTGAISESNFIESETFYNKESKIGLYDDEGNLPKTEFTLWYKEATRGEQLHNEFKMLLPNAYIHPLQGLQLGSVVMGLYYIIRHGLVERVPASEGGGYRPSHLQITLDERMVKIHKYCQSLGLEIVSRGGDETKIDWGNYHKYLNLILDTESLIHLSIALLGMKTPFSYEKTYLKYLKRRKNITKVIDSSSSNDPIFKNKQETAPPSMPSPPTLPPQQPDQIQQQEAPIGEEPQPQNTTATRNTEKNDIINNLIGDIDDQSDE